jgi:hypothetical protein
MWWKRKKYKETQLHVYIDGKYLGVFHPSQSRIVDFTNEVSITDNGKSAKAEITIPASMTIYVTHVSH